ncbi:tail tape measure protein [Bacillus phage P59]|nr:tail tape measure protein [Bacillus phage P59]
MSENFEKDLEGLMPEKSPEDRETEKKVEQKQVIDRIVRGVNDVFEKDYDFKDLGLKFTVKVKAPNALEIGKIQARLSAYLGGMNNYASEYMIVAYQMLATLRVTGTEVPKELEKDEDIYNLDILYIMGRDFKQWLDNFRL